MAGCLAAAIARLPGEAQGSGGPDPSRCRAQPPLGSWHQPLATARVTALRPKPPRSRRSSCQPACPSVILYAHTVHHAMDSDLPGECVCGGIEFERVVVERLPRGPYMTDFVACVGGPVQGDGERSETARFVPAEAIGLIFHDDGRAAHASVGAPSTTFSVSENAPISASWVRSSGTSLVSPVRSTVP